MKPVYLLSACLAAAAPAQAHVSTTGPMMHGLEHVWLVLLLVPLAGLGVRAARFVWARRRR